MLAIYISAGNDVNGNPRRGWLITDDIMGDFTDFIDEGYYGDPGGLYRHPEYKGIPRTPRINVTPSTYREAKREASRKYKEEQKTTR